MLSLLLCVGLANAAVVRNFECDFHMNAAGSHGGPLGELNGGQIRFSNIPQTTFHIDGDKIWDRNGHGCWWTREFLFPSFSVLLMVPSPHIDDVQELIGML